MSERISEGWQIRQLGEFIKEHKEKNGSNSNIPILSVTKYNGFVNSLEYFKKQVFSKDTSGYKKVTKGDFAYSTIHLDEGSLGLLKNWDAGLISPMYTVFRVNDKLNPNFLFYLMKSDEYMRKYPALGQGSINRRASISFSRLSQLDIHYPPISEQQKIVSILTSVDDIIEKTESQINKVQDLKKGMMQELLTKGIGHTEFKDSPLGSIPKEWKVMKFNDIANSITCGVASTPEYVDQDEGIPFLSAQNVANGAVLLKKYRYITKELHHKLTKNTKPEKGDILYSRVGAKYGESAVIEFDWEFSVYVSLTLIKLKKECDVYFFMYLLNSTLCKEQAKSGVFAGAGVPNLNVAIVKNFSMLVPPLIEQQKISNILRSLDIKIYLNKHKLEKIRLSKKALMQDLLTGKVRVKTN